MNDTAVAVAAVVMLSAVAIAAPPAGKGDGAVAAPEPVSILKDRPDREAVAAGLGPAYESRAGGIALRPPAGSREIHRAGNPDEIAEFVNDGKNWSLKVTHSTLSQPVPLTEHFENTRKVPGVLELTAENFKRENATAEIVRQDVIELGVNKVGMLAARVTLGTSRRLVQQAIIHATDTHYYVLVFNSPAAPKGGDSGTPDPREAEAVATFGNVLDTVQLLDRSAIKEDQDQRLFRTRAFFVNLTDKKITGALVPEQWLRLQRDGKDVGYSYVVEEPYKQGGNDGVRVGIRSRTMPDKGTQVDAESWFFSSLDRRHETWTNVAAISDGGGGKPKDYSSEVGYSDVTVAHRVDKEAQVPGQKAPPIVTDENHTLTVTRSTRTANSKPITRPVPPWYLPQAFGHLLPRLVPTDRPRGYLFASYVSDTGEVMSRYIDIGAPLEVKLGDTNYHAIPIKDRIGIEGSVTTHYLDAGTGRYLGSVNTESKVTMLASDRETLLKLWSNANLTRPAEPAKSDNNGR